MARKKENSLLTIRDLSGFPQNSLAYVEMRVILARVLWNFDLAIAEDSRDWMRGQKMYVVFEKSPLNVYFKPRV